MVIIRKQSGVILKRAGAAFKGLFNVLNNNKSVLFLDILTQDKLKEIVRVFDMNSLALIL